MERYPGGCIHIDFLKNPEPSGVSLPVPDVNIQSDKEKVSKTRDSFLAASDLVDQAKTKVADIGLDPVYHENKFLMEALSSEAR